MWLGALRPRGVLFTLFEKAIPPRPLCVRVSLKGHPITDSSRGAVHPPAPRPSITRSRSAGTGRGREGKADWELKLFSVKRDAGFCKSERNGRKMRQESIHQLSILAALMEVKLRDAITVGRFIEDT